MIYLLGISESPLYICFQTTLEDVKKLMMQKGSGSLCGQQCSWTNNGEAWEKTERRQTIAVADSREGKEERQTSGEGLLHSTSFSFLSSLA